MLGVFAEFETNLRKERQTEESSATKARGDYNGGKARINPDRRQGARAAAQLAAIHISIVALANEDLLDLADIFASGSTTPLKNIAAAEMVRRDLKL